MCKVLWDRWVKKVHVPLPSWDLHSRLQTEENGLGDSGKGGCSSKQNKTHSASLGTGTTTAPPTLRQLSMLWNTPALWNCPRLSVLILISDIRDADNWCGSLGLYQEPIKAQQDNERVFSNKIVSVAENTVRWKWNISKQNWRRPFNSAPSKGLMVPQWKWEQGGTQRRCCPKGSCP